MAAHRRGRHPRAVRPARVTYRAKTHADAPDQRPHRGLVYIHGGGFTYGNLDEFESAMRVIAEIATCVVDCQLAPEAKYQVQIEEIEYFVRWLSTTPPSKGWTRRRSRSAVTRPAAT